MSTASAPTGAMDIDAGQFHQTLASLREGIQILSPDWRYLYVNQAAASHGRKSPEELLGRTMLECYPGIDQAPIFAGLQRCMRERVAETVENEFEYPDGQRAWFELRIQPCREGLVVLSLDITQRKELEASLRQGEKLRALGQMAAGIVHDLKNIFNPIALHLQLMRSRLADRDGVDQLLAPVENAIRAGADTVESLRKFSRQEPDQAAESIDLNEMADVAVQICRPRFSEQPGAQMKRERGVVPRVLVRGSDLVTAVVNLVLNALEATLEGGTITIRTGNDGGGWLEVTDDGPGMTAEIQRRLFEPFFTTKPQGTGLGLAMVYAFVQRHHGRITVDTAPGRGTAIRLWFPPGQAAGDNDQAVPPARPAGRRLLVVEDDESARSAIRLLLEDEGFSVEAVRTGEEALACLAGYQPDVLVVDFGLPGIDGATVARTARLWQSRLPVVFMSGMDAASTALAAVLQEPMTEHVPKPIRFERLIDVLDRVAAPLDVPRRARSDTRIT